VQAPAPKKKAQKSPVQRVASDEEEDGGMFAAVLSGRSALQVSMGLSVRDSNASV
jgi:hypothetical protein